MKKLIILLLTLVTLVGCQNKQELALQENYVLHVKAKDNREYIAMFEQYTPLNEINITDYIEIDNPSNLDIEVKWVGESLSCYIDTYAELEKAINDAYENIDDIDVNPGGSAQGGAANKSLIEALQRNAGDNLVENFVNETIKDTLDYEGFRPISVYVIGKKDDNIVCEQRLDTFVLIAPEKVYNFLLDKDVLPIEDTQRLLLENKELLTINTDLYKEGYFSNIATDEYPIYRRHSGY